MCVGLFDACLCRVACVNTAGACYAFDVRSNKRILDFVEKGENACMIAVLYV